MKKILFIAGEPGSGKTSGIAKPLTENGFGFVLHTDLISKHASEHYIQAPSLRSKWMLWKLEFDKLSAHKPLEAAIYKSMEEHNRACVNQADNLIIEGVLSGHPAFRKIMLAVLEKFKVYPDDVLTLCLRPHWYQVQKNLAQRSRPEDQCLAFTKARSDDYRKRLSVQNDIQFFDNIDKCYQTATKFLQPNFKLGLITSP